MSLTAQSRKIDNLTVFSPIPSQAPGRHIPYLPNAASALWLFPLNKDISTASPCPSVFPKNARRSGQISRNRMEDHRHGFSYHQALCKECVTIAE
jgi:hypothetical protein